VLRLIDIALLTAHRGRGVGTVLVQMVLEEALSARKPITLCVEADNPARRLHGASGFARRAGSHAALGAAAPP
jgi:ribosomal protein S18 acetylase RimI-like enzyme